MIIFDVPLLGLMLSENEQILGRRGVTCIFEWPFNKLSVFLCGNLHDSRRIFHARIVLLAFVS